MIGLAPWSDAAGLAVLRRLDLADLREAELVRGASATPLALFAEWRAAQAQAAVSHVFTTAGGTPFALFALVPTGEAGALQAAFLARDHRAFRRPLAEAGLLLRAELPLLFAERPGLGRIEARSWEGHPTAAGFLGQIGFCLEAPLSGVGGPDIRFLQFSATRRHVIDRPSNP